MFSSVFLSFVILNALIGLLRDEVEEVAEKAFQSYIGVVTSPPVKFDLFAKQVNHYMQRPPFNFLNPTSQWGGMKRASVHPLLIVSFCKNSLFSLPNLIFLFNTNFIFTVTYHSCCRCPPKVPTSMTPFTYTPAPSTTLSRTVRTKRTAASSSSTSRIGRIQVSRDSYLY